VIEGVGVCDGVFEAVNEFVGDGVGEFVRVKVCVLLRVGDTVLLVDHVGVVDALYPQPTCKRQDADVTFTTDEGILTAK
jgi:hypothetical protein